MIFANLFKRPPPRPQRQHLSLASHPGSIYAIGDVHGCLDLLRQLERRILADADAHAVRPTLVLLGDYVDRGPDSAGVLDHLSGPRPRGFSRVCLAGNHEIMMLDFLAAPSPSADWLRFGGLETLASYGMQPDRVLGSSRRQLQAMVDAHVPQEHIDFLKDLPLTLSVQDLVFVHAGLRPGVEPIDHQSEDDLLWIRDEFFNAPPVDRRLVVHGHTPGKVPVSVPGRICVDTGAYATGVLSAVRLVPHHPPGFLST